MLTKSIATVLLSTALMVSAHATDVDSLQTDLQHIQNQRVAVFSEVETLNQTLATLNANILTEQQKPMPERDEYEKAKRIAEAAKEAFAKDNSLNNEANLDKTLFKLKLAEQKYEKAQGELSALQNKQIIMMEKESQLRVQLRKLDARIADNQQRISQLLNSKVEQRQNNQDVTTLLSGGGTTIDATQANSEVAFGQVAAATVQTDSNGKTWQGFVVIANPTLKETLDKKTIKELFLGKKKSAASVGRLTAINPPDGSLSYASFATHVLEMDQRALASHWAKVLFTGKGKAPKIMDTPETIKQYIARNEDAIGFVPASLIDNTIQGLMSF